jgi:MATE family multidrug resistance protein
VTQRATAGLASSGALAPTLGEEIVRLASLAWPIALAQLGMMGLHLVDTAVVGRNGVEDLAAVAIGRSIAFLTIAAGMGIPLSLEALATQAIGAGEPQTAWAALLGALRASLIAWVPITLVSFAVTLVLRPLGVEDAVAHRALLFVIGNAPGSYGFLLFLAAKTFLQGHGRTTPALVAGVVANAFNFVVCSLLVRGDDALVAVHLAGIGLPKLGAFGAGVAASLASLLLGGITFYAAWAHRPRPDAAIRAMSMARIARLGLPVGLQLFAEVGVFSVIAMVAGRLGSRVVSAHQIAIALASTTFMIALGVSGATAVRVGVAVGAGRSPRRIGFVGVGLGIGTMSFGALAFLLVPEPLVRLFTTDPVVVATAVRLLRIAAMFQLFDATQGVLAGALRGAGDVRFPFVVMSIGYWCVGFPLALGLAFGLGWGAEGLWWGLSAGLCSVALSLLGRFIRITSRPIFRV